MASEADKDDTCGQHGKQVGFTFKITDGLSDFPLFGKAHADGIV